METNVAKCRRLNPENNRSLQRLLVIFAGVIFNLLQPIEKVSDCGLKQMDWYNLEESNHQYSTCITGVMACTNY